MLHKEFNINEKVWCFNAWGAIDEGTISEIRTTQSDLKYYKIQLTSGGFYNAVPMDIFKSYGDALHEKARRSKEKVNKYKTDIKTLKDLLNFCICYMHNEEYTDYEAIQTVKEWSHEFLSINLEDD